MLKIPISCTLVPLCASICSLPRLRQRQQAQQQEIPSATFMLAHHYDPHFANVGAFCLHERVPHPLHGPATGRSA